MTRWITVYVAYDSEDGLVGFFATEREARGADETAHVEQAHVQANRRGVAKALNRVLGLTEERGGS